MTIDNLVKELLSIKNTKGSNDKTDKLKVVSNDTKMVIKVLVDPSVTLGLKKIQAPKVHWVETTKSTEDLFKLINKLQSNNINQQLRDEVQSFLSMLDKETSEVIRQVLQKTYKIGITEKTFNKIFPGLIEQHPIALAKSPTEANYIIPCILGEKYDGIRYTQVKCNSRTAGKALTRSKNIMKFPRIEQSIKQLLKDYSDEEWVIDGELELVSGSFDEIQSIVSSNIDGGDTSDVEHKIVLKIFDIIRYSDYIGKTKSAKQKDRLKFLSKLFMNNPQSNLVEAKTITVYSEEKLQEVVNKWIAEGKEGGIAKDPESVYKAGKTNAWIKIKAINDCTLECIGVTEGTNKRLGKIGALMMKSSCGTINVNVGSGLTDDMVDLYTKIPPIGKFFDVLFNQVSQNEKLEISLRLPRLKGPRIDVTEADSFEKIKSQHIGAMKLKDN